MAATSPHTPTIGRHARIRQFLLKIRTDGSGPERDPLAVAVGVFIGCAPVYGLHLPLCLAAGWLLRLNRLKVYLAANISNPLLAPLLIVSEIQAGAWIRRGHLHPISRQTLANTSPWTFGGDLVIGALVIGLVLAVSLGLLTRALMRKRTADPRFAALATRAAERYAATSLTAWEFANGKLRNDPAYHTAMSAALLPGGDTLVDLGCGQGLMLSLLLEARLDAQSGDRNGSAAGAAARPGMIDVNANRLAPHWPIYQRLIGVELRPHVAQLASQALTDAGVEIVSQDAVETPLPPCDAVILFDVLHLIPPEGQTRLLTAVRHVLRPGGIVLVRDADATAGWRFQLVRAGNRLKALAGGHVRQPFAFRTIDGWRGLFESLGFRVETFPGPADHPFANVLFRLTRRDP